MGSVVVEEGKDVLYYNRTAETFSNFYRCEGGEVYSTCVNLDQQGIPMVYPVLEKGKYVP